MSDQAGEEVSRPMVMYISSVVPAKLELGHSETVTALEVEMSVETAAELVKMLSSRLIQDAVPGAIRVRLLGHLVVG